MEIKRRKYTLRDAVGVPLRVAAVPTALALVFRIGDAVVATLSVLVTAGFIDGALRMFTQGQPLSAMLWPTAAMVLVIAWQLIAPPLAQLAMEGTRCGLRAALRPAIADKRARMAYWHLENADSWDLIGRVGAKPEDKWRDMLDDIVSTASLILQILGVLVVLVAQVWWAGLVLLLTSIPLLRVAMRFGKQSYEAERDVTKLERRYKYLGRVLTERESVEERSLFGYTPRLRGVWQRHFEEARMTRHRVEKRNMIRMKLSSMAVVLIALIVMFTLLPSVLSGGISVGMYMSLVGAVYGLVNMVGWGLGWSTKQWVKNREFMKDVTAFAALDEAPDALCMPRPVAMEALEFRDVVFRYPGTEQTVLDGLSFVVRGGEHIAFVGANGAGKTTLTKLILGLYAPDSGEILLNGKPIDSYDAARRKGLAAVVFQDFARYQVSLRDNLLLGDPEAGEARLTAAIDRAGLSGTLERLPQGMDTLLGKLREGGQDLSGGEWQRLAMARALVNPAPLRILDEPTAALDPISESRLYRQFEGMSQGHATIFISHRLGSTQLADRIYVLEGGRVVQEGSHAALLEMGGLYAEMYESQRSWYQ